MNPKIKNGSNSSKIKALSVNSKEEILNSSNPHSPDSSAEKVYGKITEIKGLLIKGWVSKPVWLEVVIDGVPFSTVMPSSKLQKGQYHFLIPVSLDIIKSCEEISIMVANIGTTIGKVKTTDIKKSISLLSDYELEGQVYHDGGLNISGWAIDPQNPDKRLVIVIRCGGIEVGRVLAEGMCYNDKEKNGYGFTFSLPISFADGHHHTVTVQDSKGRQLPGSPLSIRVVKEGLQGWFMSSMNNEKDENHLRSYKKFLSLASHVAYFYERWLPKSINFSRIEEWLSAFPPVLSPKYLHTGEELSKIVTVYLAPSVSEVECYIPEKMVVTRSIDKIETPYVLWIDAPVNLTLDPQLIISSVEIAQDLETDILYFDSVGMDSITSSFRPSWDEFLFFSNDYLGSCLLMASNLLRNSSREQDHRIIRTLAILSARKITHLPVPFYRETNQSSVFKERASILSKNVPAISFENDGTPFNFTRFRPRNCRLPHVTIIIPTKDRVDLLKLCVDSIVSKTSYDGTYDIVIVDNGSEETRTRNYFKKLSSNPKISIISYPHFFNFAAMNNMAARLAKGEILCLLNNDTVIYSHDWLQEMVSLLYLPDVEVVGAKLLWDNNLVQHGGVIVGVGGLAAHVGNTWYDSELGYLGRNRTIGQWSAVTAACFVVRKETYLEMGGFDEQVFPVSFNDVDFCLRLREEGKKIVWTPYVHIVHKESASRGDSKKSSLFRNMREERAFRERWGQYEDPFYNPNLSLCPFTPPFEALAFPPRPRDPRIVLR